MSKLTGAELIAQERKRQIEVEGWTPEHDDNHKYGELAIAAACYAVHNTDAKVANTLTNSLHGYPWDDESFKPKDSISNLIKAGGLIAAEIDRELRRLQKLKKALT